MERILGKRQRRRLAKRDCFFSFDDSLG